MDTNEAGALVQELDSRDTKRRLRALETVAEAWLRRPPSTRESWNAIAAALVRTLRDNNFKVCRAALACLETLVGHVGANIAAFLPMMIPSVVECLGNSKGVVQEKGIDLLLAITAPGVNGARDTLALLEPCFRHKNWRVRDQLVAYLGRAAGVDGPGVLQRSTERLAAVIADALNDSAAQVRQQALEAATKLLELTGESLLSQLDGRGVRSAQLVTLRCSGGSTTGETTSSAATDDVRSPTATLASAPARRGSKGPSRGSLAAATAKRKKSRLTTTSSAGGGSALARTRAVVNDGSSSGSGASTPRGGSRALAALSPASVLSPGQSSSSTSEMGEESAFSALEQLVPVKVYTERDVRREVEAAIAGLQHKSDWQRWVGAMQRLAGVALGGAAEAFPALLVGHVRASVHEMIGHKVSENRSAVAREACRCVAVLARCLTDHFGALAELWLPELLRNTTRAVVVASAGDEAARAIFGCTMIGFPRLLAYLVDTARNKSASIRCRCQEYVMHALARWNDAAFERHLPQLRNMIGAGIADADSSVRMTARRAYWVLKRRFVEVAQSIMDSLAPAMQKHVLREEEVFDAEAFVEAVSAAAQDPQPALGEKTKERATRHAPADVVPASANGSAASAGPASGRRRQQSPANLPSDTARSGVKPDVHRYPPPPRAFGGEEAFAGANVAASTRAGAARCATVVTDGGGPSGASGGGHHGARVRAGGDGLAGARRTRARAASPGYRAHTPGDADTRRSDRDEVAQIGSSRVTLALRVAGSMSTSGSGSAAASDAGIAKAGAFRVPSSGNAVAGDVLLHHDGDQQRAAGVVEGAQRVARRAPQAIPAENADRDGVAGGMPKGAFSGGAGRVVGRHKQPASSRAEAAAADRGDEDYRTDKTDGVPLGAEAGNSGARQARRAGAVSVEPVMPERRDAVRQVDEFTVQSTASHWAARVEALEGLMEVLTEGGSGGEAGRVVLKSRTSAKRLESAIAERMRDAHFRVVTAALRLLGALVRAHTSLYVGHASSLLPSVFHHLADTKEVVRQAAVRVLDSCRAAYDADELCAVLCPRVLELAPGRARTGLLEFLTVLVPHSAAFLRSPGHVQSLTQRVAVALAQSPPPVNWDGGPRDEASGAIASGTAAGAAAATRLLTALFRRDSDAFVQAVCGGLPPDSSAVVHRALKHACPAAAALCASSSSSLRLPPPAKHQQHHHHHRGRREGGLAAGGNPGSHDFIPLAGDPAHGQQQQLGDIPGTGAVTQITSEDEPEGRQSATDGTQADSRAFPAHAVASMGEPGERDATPDKDPRGIGSFGQGPRAKITISNDVNLDGVPAGGPTFARDGNMPANLPAPVQTSQASSQQRQQRVPLAPVTSGNVNVVPDGRGCSGKGLDERRVRTECERVWPVAVSSKASSANPRIPHETNEDTSGTASCVAPRRTVSTTPEAEPADAARKLIAGLSPGARTHLQVEALSLLRGLADGEGAAGRAEFWPRYFGQVLMLLMEGAAGGGSKSRGPISASPSRRRAVLRAKFVQGVRCLVARRGRLFEDCVEVVVSRMVDIGGGDPCVVVRCEAEACLVDLVPVLDSVRFLAVLTPYLVTDQADAAESGNSEAVQHVPTPEHVLTQCAALGALCALTSRLSSPVLLRALNAGPLLRGLAAALNRKDLEARKRTVLVLVEMYQVLEETLLPFIANFPTSRLKLITMYIEQRRSRTYQPTREDRRKGEPEVKVQDVFRSDLQPAVPMGGVPNRTSPLSVRPIR